YISGELLRLAKRKDVIVFVLTHPRKMDEGRKARGRDVKYSGALTQDCHVMMFLHRDEIDRAEELTEDEVAIGALSPLTEVHVEGKHCPSGKTLLVFEGEFSRFRKLTDEERKEVRDAWEKERRRRRNRRG